MDDGNTYSIKNDGPVQFQIIGGQGHYIGPHYHYHDSDSESTSPKSRWNVPYQRNPYFTGRDGLLARLHEQLHAGQDMALSQAISGLGGVGKTQLAVEYAYRYREEYRYILWVRAESEESLISSYIALGHLLKLPQKDAQDQHITVQAVKHWLQNNGDWLLILDNADEPRILLPYIPAAPQGHCLYTTRASTLGSLAACLLVESFSDEQGALFLLRRAQLLAIDFSLEQAPEQERELALQITSELGGLPLALDQAGAYIEEAQTSLAEYLRLYQQRRIELLAERGDIVLDHPEPVATTWFLSFERVAQRHPAAADLLRLFAFLAPDDIPEEIITGGAVHLGETLALIASDPFLLDKALKALLAYSLIKRDREKKALSIHRLVQAVLQDAMFVQERRQWMECAILTVGESFPNVTKFEQWEACERWLPHAQLCAIWAEHEKIETHEVADLLCNTSYCLCERAFYREAEQLYKRSLAIYKKEPEAWCSDMAGGLNGLAILYRRLGRYEEAEVLYKHALMIFKKKFGEWHFNTAMCLNNLALLYRRQGMHKDAERLYKQILIIWDRELGKLHPSTAICMNNLASLYWEQERYKEAEPLYKQVLAIFEKELGEWHLYTATTLNNLANIYQNQGKYREAELLLFRALQIREKMLGEQHPDTAMCLHNLARLYDAQGRYLEAEPLYRRALAINEESLGESHPDTVKTLNNLALLYIDQGRQDEAEPLLQQALDIREKILGEQHPDTATSLSGLAEVFVYQGRYKEAESLYKRVLAIREKALGERHADTAMSLNNLALFYWKQEMYREAEPLLQRALAICERSLGAEHPHTHIARENYTMLQQMVRKTNTSGKASAQEKLRSKQKKKARQREKRSKQQQR